MSGSITNLVVLAFSYIAANAATLVPVPKMPQPSFPVAGLEANQGQANAGILFLSPTSAGSIGVTAQSVLFSPLGATLNLVASNPNPSVSFSDPLSGLANSYTGADPAKWFTGIPRYATATLTAIYPGIDAQYMVNTTGVFLNVMLRAGANLNAVQFAIPQATSIGAGSNGLTAIFGFDRDVAPELIFSGPVASQTGLFGQMNRNASFIVQSTNGFALAVEGIDPTLPLQISIQLSAPAYAAPPYVADSTQQAADAAGNTYYVIPVPDAAGKAAPFPTLRSPACGTEIATPIPCMEVFGGRYAGVHHVPGGRRQRHARLSRPHSRRASGSRGLDRFRGFPCDCRRLPKHLCRPTANGLCRSQRPGRRPLCRNPRFGNGTAAIRHLPGRS
jgi:hypothetical protein